MSSSRQEYIEAYSELAKVQMRRYGIPASVTLAQAIIESANGKSTLSNVANNHFGIKGDFHGNYVLADDDKPNEHFKKYDNVGQSYEDHSKVLMNDRYRKLTKDLTPDDYRGWAAAIKKGGYATDGNYVKTIVGVIEGANLQKYDQMVMQEMKSQGKSFGIDNNPLEISTSLKDSNGKRIEPDINSEGRKYSFPLKRSEFMLVTSPFGLRRDPMDHSKQQMHKGIDIQTKHEAVLATEDNGRVIKASQNINTGGGRTVTIEYDRNDGSKYQCTYMHLDSIAVKVGDTVSAGQKLGISGNTGTRTTGEHLHFGVKVVSNDGASRDLDPAAYLADIAQRGNIELQEGIAPDASVALTKFHPRFIDYTYSSSTPGTLVFSEIYYPYGWKATIDGTPVEHFRADYTLRALNVPAGTHAIHFEFDPDSVRKGDTVATVCILLMYLVMAGFIAAAVVRRVKRRKAEQDA